MPRQRKGDAGGAGEMEKDAICHPQNSGFFGHVQEKSFILQPFPSVGCLFCNFEELPWIPIIFQVCVV
jgi:hypothetical protein